MTRARAGATLPLAAFLAAALTVLPATGGFAATTPTAPDAAPLAPAAAQPAAQPADTATDAPTPTEAEPSESATGPGEPSGSATEPSEPSEPSEPKTGGGEPSEPDDSATKPGDDEQDADRDGSVNGEDEDQAEGEPTATSTEASKAALAADPTAVADRATVRAGGTVRVRVAANDVLGGAGVVVPEQPVRARAVVVGDAIDVTPDVGVKGELTFTYELQVGGETRASADVTVTVLPPPDVAAADDHARTGTFGEGHSGTVVDVLRNDVLPAGAEFGDVVVEIVGRPGHGTVQLNACPFEFCPEGSVLYTPEAGFSGRDTFVYGLSVDGDVVDTATVAVDVEDLPQGSVVPVDDTITVRPGETVVFDPTRNDVGAFRHDVVVTGNPQNGRVGGPPPGSENPNLVTYTPDAGFAGGVDTFTYQLQPQVIVDAVPVERVPVDRLPDIPVLLLAAAVAADTATVTVIVNAPISQPDTAATTAGDSVDIDVRANDSVLGGHCLAVPSPQPMAGTARVTEGGTVTYTPAPGFVGTDEFVYGYTPGCEGDAIVARTSVTVTVRPPGLTDDSASTAAGPVAGLPVTIDVLENDDRAARRFRLEADQGQNGATAVRTPGEGRPVVRYTPKAGFSGTDSFRYRIVSGESTLAEATVTVRVAAVAAAGDVTVTTAGEAVEIDAGGNDTLADGVRAVVVGEPESGEVSIVGESRATFRYVPGPGLTTDEFDYALVAAGEDGADVELARATVKVTRVEAVPDTARSRFRLPVEVNVLANDVGVAEAGAGVVAVELDPAPDALRLRELRDGLVEVTPVDGFAGTARFTYRLVQGERTVDTAAVEVEVPERTEAVGDAAATDPGVAVEVEVLDNDANTTGLEVRITGQPGRGEVEVDDDGVVTYTPDADKAGEDRFGYALVQPGGGDPIAAAEVVVTVRAPRATDDALTALNGPAPTPEAVDVLANDRFGAGFAVELGDADHGDAVLESGGVVRYTPQRGFSGSDTVPYDLVEPDGRVAASAVVRVRVLRLDARDDTARTQEGEGVRVPVLRNDVVPPDVTVVLAAPGPSSGTVVVNADGSVDYRPVAGTTGTDRFRYSVTGVVRGTRVVLDTAVVRVTVVEEEVPPTPDPDPDPNPDPDPDPQTDPDPGTPTTEPTDPAGPAGPTTPKAPDDVKAKLDVTSASPLSQVTVTGSGCPGYQPVIVEVDGRVAARPTAGSSGEFQATVPAPDKVGRHSVAVTCGSGTTTSDLDVVVTTMQSGTQAPAGAAAAVAALLLFFLLSGMGLNPTGRRASARSGRER